MVLLVDISTNLATVVPQADVLEAVITVLSLYAVMLVVFSFIINKKNSLKIHILEGRMGNPPLLHCGFLPTAKSLFPSSRDATNIWWSLPSGPISLQLGNNVCAQKSLSEDFLESTKPLNNSAVTGQQ